MAVPVTRMRMMAPHSKSSLRLSNTNLSNSGHVHFLCRCAPSELQSLRPELSLSVGTHAIPHPDKVEKGGEDAFFVSSYRGGVIAVADGVSGWAEQDVDPSLFSKELMANASRLVDDEEVRYDPGFLIDKAHTATTSRGSATIIVAMLEEVGVLKIGNVGDCGLKLLREGQIIFSTTPQEHYFDCPYQLSSEGSAQTYLDASVRLAVAGAFHTSFMEPAVSRLEAALAATEIKSPRIPVISNVDAQPHADPDTIKKILARQVTSPVQWETTIKTLLSKGLKSSYELGPGKVIAGIFKRVDKSANVENISA